MKISLYSYQLKFRYPFTISKGTKTHQPTLILELENFGMRAYGEAPAIKYYDIPVDKMISDLENKRKMAEKFSFTDPERFWHFLHHLFPSNNFLVCALDIAGWDLYGKLNNLPLKALWNLQSIPPPFTDYTIGIDSIENMVLKLKNKPWPIYKIKLGTENDIAIIEQLRKQTDAIFRIDANAAWTANEALEKINVFQHMGVEFIEQPLSRDDWTGMKWLFERSPLPLYADESCVREHDVEKCHQHFHGINIKLTKCGGITPALRMIQKARELQLKTMLGSMNESTIGSAAIAHLSPLVDHIDIDGPLLLEEDVATGLEFLTTGEVVTSGKPGLGITFTGLYKKAGK